VPGQVLAVGALSLGACPAVEHLRCRNQDVFF
jgi:hypothetical protein